MHKSLLPTAALSAALAVLLAACVSSKPVPAAGQATVSPAAPDKLAAPAPAAPAAQATAPAGADATVVMNGMNFEPRDIKVKAGTTVTFINKDAKNDHSVVEGDHKKQGLYTPLFKSPDLATGQKFAYQFGQPGTYQIFCLTDSHFLQGMVGKVEVTP